MSVAVAGGVSDSRRRLCPPRPPARPTAAALADLDLASVVRRSLFSRGRSGAGGRLTLLLCGPRLGRPAGWPSRLIIGLQGQSVAHFAVGRIL